ncbi:MAG: hypothetical protein EOP34_07965 [Rickettsiales bacterium]|nr:MAG: hypothetical protein EOP34_07965 [Rickettsiales bacterium]
MIYNDKSRIVNIEEKIEKLQKEKADILQKRQDYLSDFISKLELSSYSDELIIGGFVFIKNVLTNIELKEEYAKLQEEWHKAGSNFLKRRNNRENKNRKANSEPKGLNQKVANSSTIIE